MANTVDFGLKGGLNDYSAELSDIERRRAYAQALQQQGLAPMGGTEMAGGWAIKRSPMEGIGKVLQAYAGARGQEKATEEQRALGDRARADAMNWYGSQPQARPGSPAMPSESYTSEFSPETMQTSGRGAVSPSQPTKQEQMAWLMKGGMNPMTAPMANAMLAQQLKGPEVGKVDVDKFTTTSVAKFMQTGNHADLVPRDKHEHVQSVGPTGAPVTQFFNPYAPPSSQISAPMPGFLGQLQALGILQPGMEKDPRVQQILSGYLGKETGQITPALAAELKIKLGHLANEGARVGMERQNTTFNTGGGQLGGGAGAGAAPQPFNAFGGMAPTQNPQAPYNAPQPLPQAPQGAPRPVQPVVPQPQPAPAPAQPSLVPGGAPLTGKSAQQIAVDLAKQQGEMQQKREFNMGGINEALNTAEGILKGTGGPKPTQSVSGSIYDSAGRLIGKSPEGAAQADQLRAIGGALVSKVPRMEGPQSDKDVMLYKQMAGDIGNDTLPVARRLAALQTVRQLYAKYERLNVSAQPAQPDNDPLGIRRK